jgi:hypothetical protein
VDLSRALEPLPLLALAAGGIAAASYGAYVGRRRGSPWARAAEAAGLAVLGGFIATTLVGALLDLGDDSREAGLFVGWLFFFFNGLVDTVLALFDVQLLTRPGVLLASAVLVGSLTGALHGAHRVYDWRRTGVAAYLADVTWGLSGSTTGGVTHVVDTFIAERAPEERMGASRFLTGFHPPGRSYAFTQGAVMSNLKRAPGTPLYRHERTHVLQSRVFGPLYTVSYLGWMAVAVLPAALLSAVLKPRASRVEGVCYFSNPWEVWAYVVQRKAVGEPRGADVRTRLSHARCLSEPLCAVLGLMYLLAVGVLLITLCALALG